MESSANKLIEMPVIRGCIEKWNAGRAAHGPEFQGNPLDELYGEVLDALNYCEQAELEGIDMGGIWDDLLSIARQVQEIWGNTSTAVELTAKGHDAAQSLRAAEEETLA
jgi:hypothetical protein